MKKLTTKKLLYCALFAALTAVGAFLKLPLGTVLITLQFLFTALAGILLGPKLGALSQLLYVLLGFLGLPIFGAGSGPSYIFQPTCGFVIALPLTAFLIGKIANGSRKPKKVVAACLAGLAVLYLIGIGYMGVILNLYLGKGISVGKLLALYLLPYLPGDCLKIAATALLAAKLPENLTGEPAEKKEPAEK